VKCGEMMTPNPTSCRGDQTVERAAMVMEQEDVGLLPVVAGDGAKLVGVVSDRDIVIKVVAAGRDPRSTAISEMMTADPVTCRPEDHAELALECMANHQVRRIPIVDGEGILVGIIAQADVATRLGRPNQTGQVVEAISEGDKRTSHIADDV
jgi:CBS domain-containing protein